MKRLRFIILLMGGWLLFSGFFGNDSTPQEQRKEILKENQSILTLLYKSDPNAKKLINNSYGYATFNSTGINVFLISTENGTGMAKVNKTGDVTYMKMFSGGGGIGLGVKDFRAIFIFENKNAFDNFIDSGWEANAQADAAAKSGDKGGAIDEAITVAPGVKLYKLTKNGLAAQATIQGTKYWKNDDLN